MSGLRGMWKVTDFIILIATVIAAFIVLYLLFSRDWTIKPQERFDNMDSDNETR